MATELTAATSPNLAVDLASFGAISAATVTLLSDPDPYARNTADAPDAVTPRVASAAIDAGTVTIALPAVSWAAIEITLA